MAGLGAEVLVAGHGLPIFGADRIRDGAAATLPSCSTAIEDQTLALMNRGCRSTG